MKNTYFSVLFSFFILLTFSAVLSAAEEPYRIALFKDGGVSDKTCASVSKVVENDPMFQIEIVDSQQIRDGILDRFDIVLLPGGLAYKQIDALQPEGMKKIKDFVKSGKGYVGICAGAYVPVKQDFLNAEFKSPIWWRGRGVVKIEFSEFGKQIVGEDFQGQQDVFYANGPIVHVNVDPCKPQCHVLAWFRTEMAKGKCVPGIQIDSPAIILSAYGKGLVATFSPHLESEPYLYEPILKVLHHVGKNARMEKTGAEISAETGSEDTFSDAERTRMVEYMRTMAEVTWVPKVDITWFDSDAGVIYRAGETYRGIPYTQFDRRTSLESFKELLQDEDGKSVYVGPAESEEYRGVDGSAACSYAWRHVIPNFPVLKTWHMEPGAVCLVDPKTGFPEPVLTKIGDYKWTDFHDSKAVIAENGEDVITECYRQLKPGDGIVKRPYGQVRLVSRLDAENQKVYIIEQCGLTPDGKLRNDHQSWRVEYECSFRDLLDEGYLPIRPSKHAFF